MNRLTLLFALSVALNVGLVTLLLLHTASSPDARHAEFEQTPADAAASALENSASTPGDTSALAEEYRKLYSAMRTSGIPEMQVRRILRAIAWADWQDDLQQLQRDSEASDQFWTIDYDFGTSVDQQRKGIELRRLREAALASVIDNTESLAPRHSHDRIALPGLSSEKRREVALLEEDYALLMNETNHAEDRAALRLLEEERREDLAAILSPEELKNFELRNSNTARLLRQDLRYFRPTEQEFRELFSLRRDYEAAFLPSSGDRNPDRQREREEAEYRLQQEIRAILGQERFADFQKTRDPEYRQLAALSQHLDLPLAVADEVHDFRSLVEHQEATILADETLTTEDRREAMQILADDAQAMVREALGERGYNLYAENAGWWLRRLQEITAPPSLSEVEAIDP